MADMINEPPHYTRGKTELKDFIHQQDLNYHLGNVLKYIVRAGYKPQQGRNSRKGLEEARLVDLKKARFYLNDEIAWLERRLEDGTSD